MAGFIEGVDRGQSTLFPERLEDWIGEDHLVRVVDLFVAESDLSNLGFERISAARTGRPGDHQAVLLKRVLYGDLNHVPSSRHLEREAGRNVEVMWLVRRQRPRDTHILPEWEAPSSRARSALKSSMRTA